MMYDVTPDPRNQKRDPQRRQNTTVDREDDDRFTTN